jgi:DDE superfamily endonuclease
VQMFAPMARSDQRTKGATYLRGLLLDGRSKSMQPMAQRLGVDHQGLQQFLTTSTWDTRAVRVRLARRAVEVVQPVAWVVDDTGFPKDGKGSPCVARQYSGTLGKVANCQIGVSVQRSPTPRRVRWTGSCSCRRRGMTRPSTRRPAVMLLPVGVGAGYQKTSTTVRSE